MASSLWTRIVPLVILAALIVGGKTIVRRVIRTLPAGCSTVRVGGVAYSQCGATYYQRVGAGYQVVVLR